MEVTCPNGGYVHSLLLGCPRNLQNSGYNTRVHSSPIGCFLKSDTTYVNSSLRTTTPTDHVTSIGCYTCVPSARPQRRCTLCYGRALFQTVRPRNEYDRYHLLLTSDFQRNDLLSHVPLLHVQENCYSNNEIEQKNYVGFDQPKDEYIQSIDCKQFDRGSYPMSSSYLKYTQSDSVAIPPAGTSCSVQKRTNNSFQVRQNEETSGDPSLLGFTNPSIHISLATELSDSLVANGPSASEVLPTGSSPVSSFEAGPSTSHAVVRSQPLPSSSTNDPRDACPTGISCLNNDDDCLQQLDEDVLPDLDCKKLPVLSVQEVDFHLSMEEKWRQELLLQGKEKDTVQRPSDANLSPTCAPTDHFGGDFIGCVTIIQSASQFSICEAPATPVETPKSTENSSIPSSPWHGLERTLGNPVPTEQDIQITNSGQSSPYVEEQTGPQPEVDRQSYKSPRIHFHEYRLPSPYISGDQIPQTEFPGNFSPRESFSESPPQLPPSPWNPFWQSPNSRNSSPKMDIQQEGCSPQEPVHAFSNMGPKSIIFEKFASGLHQYGPK